MLKTGYDWDDIRVFLAVYEARSFSAAARNLGASQPTIGRRIKSLEQRLNNRLFERLADGLSPTEAAVSLASKAFPMAEAAESLTRHSALLSDESVGSVRISMNEQAAMLLAGQIGNIRKALPGIELELVITHIEASLSRREADLLIRFCKPKRGNLYSQKLASMPFAVFTSADSLQSGIDRAEDLVAWSRQAHLPWIGWDDEHSYQPDASWMKSNLGERTPVIRINHAMMMQTLLRQNLGIGLLPSVAGDQDPQLKRLTPDIPGLEATLYLIVHGDLRFVPAIRSVMEQLRAVMA
ncbi:LysR family transcriptional regulator [Kiloniella laminariae]|uniref:LysR family transcriptional regulator n=1 Tax=Kiloniella laminariae TaxID=454162 RepID=A0ABT4LPH8_9PROT|nr:LysR family transcriptional regulator [Kiloniella laminariae]MCZ4283040.1 LysR family transcriptional regulator [Kiloniella laminariae]